MMNIMAIARQLDINRSPSALCTVIETHGSTPLKKGAKMIVWTDGKTFGTIGGGNLEYKVIDDALEVIKKKQAKVFEHHLVQDHQMCCGGIMKIYIEPVIHDQELYIFGAGHVGNAVSKLAVNYNFNVHVIDERFDFINRIGYDHVEAYHQNHQDFLKTMPFNSSAYIVICTHLHEYDRQILACCINKPHAYLGMIGSQRKVTVTRKLFLKNGIASESELNKVDMPMGFNISAVNPSEIALSIVARLVSVRNNLLNGIAHDSSNETLTNNTIETYAETNSNSNGCW